MGFENVWNSHPKEYGKGGRSCKVCGNGGGIIRKYGLNSESIQGARGGTAPADSSCACASLCMRVSLCRAAGRAAVGGGDCQHSICSHARGPERCPHAACAPRPLTSPPPVCRQCFREYAKDVSAPFTLPAAARPPLPLVCECMHASRRAAARRCPAAVLPVTAASSAAADAPMPLPLPPSPDRLHQVQVNGLMRRCAA